MLSSISRWVPVSELDLLLAGAETTAEEMGDFVVESIAPGLASYQADLVIPNNLIGDQDYVIIAMVDPQANVTNDVDLQDNLSRGFNKNFNHPTTRVITITDSFINDLSIENAEVGEGFILLETPSSNFSDGMTASNVVLIEDDPRESNAVGHIDVKKLGADSMSAIIQVDVIVDGVGNSRAHVEGGRTTNGLTRSPMMYLRQTRYTMYRGIFAFLQLSAMRCLLPTTPLRSKMSLPSGSAFSKLQARKMRTSRTTVLSLRCLSAFSRREMHRMPTQLLLLHKLPSRLTADSICL